MPYTPERTPSGRWRGGFWHPVLNRKIRKTFDYPYEAEAWAVTEENRAKAAADATSPAPAASPASSPASPAPMINTSMINSGPWKGPKLGEHGTEYLARRAGELEHQTRNKYRSHLNGLHIPVGVTGALADHHVGMITPEVMQQWRTDSRAAGVQPPTVNGRMLFVRMLYGDLIRSRSNPLQVADDPTAGMKKLAEPERPDYIVEADEESLLLDAALAVGGEPLRTAYLAGLDAGLRWQEVYGLRKSAFRNGGDLLEITDVVEKDNPVPRPYTKGNGGTDHRSRVVMTTGRLKAALLDLAATKRYGDLLFTTPGGGLWEYNNHRNRQWIPSLTEIGQAEPVTKPTSKIRKRGPLAGQPFTRTRWQPLYGFHALRHTCATMWGRQGLTTAQIQTLLGHADERMTKRYVNQGSHGYLLELVRADPRKVA
jgi:integrase